jgi:hypothetical protein
LKIYYVNLDIVDCTADPHVLEYDTVEKMLADALKVCESDVVRAINVVRLYIGEEIEVIINGEKQITHEEFYESDYYRVPFCEDDKKKVAKGPYAKKHKVEGLVFDEDSPYKGRTVIECVTTDGKPVKIVRGYLPPGLTGVKAAIEIIRKKLKENPLFGNFFLSIGVVWDEFGDHNCSDYIDVDGRYMTVDYSNQDWYVYRDNYERHLERLANVLGISPQDLRRE